MMRIQHLIVIFMRSMFFRRVARDFPERAFLLSRSSQGWCGEQVATDLCRERITNCPADSRRPLSILKSEFPEVGHYNGQWSQKVAVL